MKKGSKLSTYLVLRERAVAMSQQGRPQKDIASALGVAQSTVSKWLIEYRQHGSSSLERPRMGGSKRRISPQQRETLRGYLEEGAEAHGFTGAFWTRDRVREVIAQEFSIDYGRTAVGELLTLLGYSLQKPRLQSTSQDAESVRQWKEERLPALKKKRKKKAT